MRIGLALPWAVIATGLLLAAEPSALAQAYPSKPIHIVITTGPGSFVDIIARVLSTRMPESLGQPVIPENRPGAAGQIAADFVAKAAPDGYTLLVSSPGTLTVGPQVGRTPYDPLKDFTPISMLATAPTGFAVTPGFPAKTFAEFLSYVRAHPSAVSYSHPGTGSLMHLGGEHMKLMAGIDMQGVPYRGAAPAATAIVTGEVQVGFADLPSLKPLHEAGRLRILAVVDPVRTAYMPQIPTVAESGLPGYDAGGWGILVAPAGTPEPIVARLNAEVRKAYDKADVIEALKRAAVDPLLMSPQDTAKFLRTEYEKWGKLIKQVGIKPQQ
jgi:tripartite-type tricarboxylate transporter receptor subunit TctC